MSGTPVQEEKPPFRQVRADFDDDTVVVLNFSTQVHDALPLGLPFPGLWKVRFNSDSPHYAPEFGGMDAFDVEADGPALDGCEQSAVLMLGPYSAVVLTRES